MAEDVLFDSQLFSVKRLAEGVYALIEREDRTGNNAGTTLKGYNATW